MSNLLLPHHTERRSPMRLAHDAKFRARSASYNAGAWVASVPLVVMLAVMVRMVAA